MARFMNTIPTHEYYDVPARGTAGGLCMAWNSTVKIEILNSSLSYICARVTVKDKPPWVILGVYGDPTHFQSRYIWQTLTELITMHGSVCLLGDFNEILDMSEKYGGNTQLKPNTVEFQEFVFRAGLVDIGYKGPAFTWTNNRNVSDAIYQRLDRVLVTPQWLELYPNAYVNHLPMIHSDHCPILLRIKKPPDRKRDFRMETWWFHEPSFRQAWVQKWQENENRPWEDRWADMKKNIQAWANKHKTPRKKLDELARKIYEVQKQHPAVRDHNLETSLLQEYSRVEVQHEVYWRQRSRLKWEQEGDRNTKFFHTVATNRRRHNLIVSMEDETGRMTGDEKKIRRRFVAYFKNLYSPIRAHEPETTQNDISDFSHHLQPDNSPRIEDTAHQQLTRLPDFYEVRRTLFQMGPDKSPGPDGVTCRFLQEHWQEIGLDLVSKIREIFLTGVVPNDWLKCNVILIPKNSEPLTPNDYRPLSIGNVTYRLLMKLVASRLRPHIRRIISQEQTAFISGRCISDNIILVKEAIHSFQSARYKQHSFMLKADITKAFDKIEWTFLQAAMTYLNVPVKIVELLMFSFKHAKVTIQVNGSGDGFINPIRGLRQGCPMSPYCFIMVMEMLTRMIWMVQSRDLIRGVKLAPSCPTLTHIIYADDLILLGNLEEREVRQLDQLMQKFGEVSGLLINPAKSKLWFSKNCTQAEVRMVRNTLKAGRAGTDEKYLGAILSHKNCAKQTGLMLLDKLKAKLTGWRSNMLSHAGRLVLIKSVLMSIPVYFMSLEVIPVGLIRQMESIIAKFFWGKTDKTRYLAFVSWGKICQPLEKGGLGVRQLKSFGEALFLKIVWDMMSNKDKIWVKVCRGKYYQHLGFWRAINVNGTSQVWRQTVKLRDFFKQNVKWRIVDGQSVEALSQPWYSRWEIADHTSRVNRRVTVENLFDFEGDQWKYEELTSLMGHDTAQHIVQTVTKPRKVPGLKDHLIWDCTKSGKYLVKEGYNCLISRMGTHGVDISWKHVWTWKKVVPKVRMFMWRLLSNALPLAQNLHCRINNISPMCQRCNQENEFATHCFFFCQGSRMVWFAGELGMRTDDLPLNIVEAVLHITQGMNEDQISIVCYTLWEIWLARNDALFQHAPFQPIAVCKKVNVWKRGENQDIHRLTRDNLLIPYDIQMEGWQIVIDASWDATHKAGIAFLAYHAGRLKWMQLECIEADDPFQAEAIAMKRGVECLIQLPQEDGAQVIQFFSDCINLISAVQDKNLHELPSWRALQTVAEIIEEVRRSNTNIVMMHVRREAVRPAHVLANKARRMRVNYQGQPSVAIMQENGIGMNLDGRFFQQVQEAPP